MNGLLVLLAVSNASVLVPDCMDGSPRTRTSNVVTQRALVRDFSALHGPIPARGPGSGALALELGWVPEHGCTGPFVDGATWNRNADPAPVVARPRISLALDGPGGLVPYAGLGYVPPVQMVSSRTVGMGAEMGVGWASSGSLSLGVRGHAALSRTIGNLARHPEQSGRWADDLLHVETAGVDGMLGLQREKVSPYLSAGWISTAGFLYVSGAAEAFGATIPYRGPVVGGGLVASLARGFDVTLEAHVVPGWLHTARMAISIPWGGGDTGDTAAIEVEALSDDEREAMPLTVEAWKIVGVKPDDGAALYAEIMGEPVPCRLRFEIDDQGRQRALVVLDCPDALKPSAKTALKQWEFFPPRRGDRAEWAKHEIELTYQAHRVALPSPPTLDGVLVQVPPYGVPRWAESPIEARGVSKWMQAEGVNEVKCTAFLDVGEMGTPTMFEVQSCPAPVAELVEKQARRWGFDLVGGSEGDGTRYLLVLERTDSE